MSVNVPYLGDVVEVSGVYLAPTGAIVQPGSRTMEGEIIKIEQGKTFPLSVRAKRPREAGFFVIGTSFDRIRYLGRANG